jgi:FemAB-related protein (PEP-CTERM system-associated)
MSEITVAGMSDQRRWDTFVLSRDDAGPYHLYAWKQAIEAAYGHKTYYLIFKAAGQDIQGVLPLVFVKPPLIKGTLVSLPFCDYGGILATGDEVKRALHDAATELSEKLSSRLELRSKVSEPVLQGSSRLGVLSHKVRMVLDLPQNSDILWKSFNTKLRTKIRKPQNEGFEFRLGSAELIEDFYEVFCINMRDLGSPVHSKLWINKVVQEYSDKAHVGVVYTGNKPVAGGIILNCRDTVTNPWASALNEYSKMRPNTLLYWGFLKYASDNGFKRFDFGRSTPGEGTYVFKEQWGANPEPLSWYGEGLVDLAQTEITSGKARILIEKAWSKLPQRLVDVLGPAVRRYITL